MKLSVGFGTATGMTLMEVMVAVIVLALITSILVALGGGILDANRATNALVEMARIYTAAVGDPSKNFYGYVGDTGVFPTSLMDLVRVPDDPNNPGNNLPGWNGPYLTDARVQSGVLYDPFGAPYECYHYADNTQAVADQFAIISAGPDRGTSNMATTNACTDFNGSSISTTYATSGDDLDNVVYPRFTDNPSLVTYNHVGTLSLTVFNFDRSATVNTLVPGCPHLYTIKITPVPYRSANDEISFPYAPGAASVDLPQGLYNVQVTSPNAQAALWEEQVAIAPGATVSRTANIYTGLNSGTSTTQLFSPVTSDWPQLRLIMFTSTITTLAGALPYTTVRACSQVFAQTASTNQIVDTFVYPNLSLVGGASYQRQINQKEQCSLSITNQNKDLAIRNQVQVRATEVIIGVVSNQGKYKTKTFLNLRNGTDIQLLDIGGNSVFSDVVACSGGTATPMVLAN